MAKPTESSTQPSEPNKPQRRKVSMDELLDQLEKDPASKSTLKLHGLTYKGQMLESKDEDLSADQMSQRMKEIDAKK